jgi:malate dehydrogenase (oxaloacetate-decarboxylating)
MDEWEVFPREAAATAIMAQQQGIARLSKSGEQLQDEAAKVIRQAREATQLLMREGCIP